jgi:hypothetical protein
MPLELNLILNLSNKQSINQELLNKELCGLIISLNVWSMTVSNESKPTPEKVSKAWLQKITSPINLPLLINQ